MVGIEYVNMMTATDRLDDAAAILGHFDATGLLQVEGPGFWVLLEGSIDMVMGDQPAAAVRATFAERELDGRDALTLMEEILTTILNEVSS